MSWVKERAEHYGRIEQQAPLLWSDLVEILRINVEDYRALFPYRRLSASFQADDERLVTVRSQEQSGRQVLQTHQVRVEFRDPGPRATIVATFEGRSKRLEFSFQVDQASGDVRTIHQGAPVSLRTASEMILAPVLFPEDGPAVGGARSELLI